MKLDTKLSKLILFVLHTFGLWRNSKSFMLYKMCSYAIHFIFSLLFLLFMVLNFATIDNIIDATDALFPTLTVAAYFFKAVNFYLNADGMQRIFADTMKFRFENDNEIQLTNEKLRFLYKLAVGFMTTAHVTIILTFLRVLFVNDPPQLPLPCWYPIDWQHNNGQYWIAYTYQMTGAFIVLNINCSMDVFSIYVMAIIARHLEILGDRLANITSQCDTRNYVSTAEQKRMNEELIGCIKVHESLIRIINDVEGNFSFGSFSQISFSGVILCSAVYQLTMLSPTTDFVRYAYCVTFSITVILQIFMISYFGETLLTASSLLINRAYSTSWYVASGEFRTTLLILMLQLQREKKLCAGKIFPLNLDLFTTIMKFSYRLYAVLQ